MLGPFPDGLCVYKGRGLEVLLSDFFFSENAGHRLENVESISTLICGYIVVVHVGSFETVSPNCGL